MRYRNLGDRPLSLQEKKQRSRRYFRRVSHEDAMKELQGKVAVSTGAARGFGRNLRSVAPTKERKVILTDIDTGGLGTTGRVLSQSRNRVPRDWPATLLPCRQPLSIWQGRHTTRFATYTCSSKKRAGATAGAIWTAHARRLEVRLGYQRVGWLRLRSFVPRMLAQKERILHLNTAPRRSSAPPGSGLCREQPRRSRDHGNACIKSCRPECADRAFRAMPRIC